MSAAHVNPKWASFAELVKMGHLLVLSLGLGQYWSSFKLLLTRISRLGKQSGTKFLVMYLKECLRLTLAFLNFTKTTSPQKGGACVKIGKSGLPLIIPGAIRRIMWSDRIHPTIVGTLVIRVVLSIFRFYAVLQFSAKPDLGTIIGPFTGVGTTLPLEEIRAVLWLFPTVKMHGLRWNIAESAGPNGPKATWWSGADAIAFLFHPYQWVMWVCFSLLTGRYLLVIWILCIQVLALPGLLVILVMRLKLPTLLGRLVCLKEGGGKRRVIAITDWWTQMAFRPIHDIFFAALRKIPQDGTFHQWKPIELWVLPRIRLGGKAFSFDLTAATDRLPIDFQIQVMGILIGPTLAWLWGQLIARSWEYDGQFLRYAVGQPMGAYSSWAMLAFCHHVLVQIAALRAGFVGWFPWYAIVGDDIVIADELVAEAYKGLLHHLGVQISAAKSLVSESGLLEFAKRHASCTRGEVSGMSPSLLLATIRSHFLLAVFAVQLFDRGWISNPVQLRGMLRAAKKVLRTPSRLIEAIFTTIIGPSGVLRNSFHVTAFADLWFTAISGLSRDAAVPFILLAFAKIVEADMADKEAAAIKNFDTFVATWWRRSLFGGSIVAGILSIPLMIVSPGIWVYLVPLFRGLSPSYKASLNIHGILNPEDAHKDGAIRFELLDIEDLVTLDWSQGRRVSNQLAFTRDLTRVCRFWIKVETRMEAQYPLSTATSGSIVGIETH